MNSESLETIYIVDKKIVILSSIAGGTKKKGVKNGVELR